MSDPKRLTALLTEHKQSLENLSRATTIGRPLSPMHIKELIDNSVSQVSRILAEFGENQSKVVMPPTPPAAIEARPAKIPTEAKPK